MKFNLGDYDLGDLGLGDFSLGDLGLGDFNLGDFDLIPENLLSVFINILCFFCEFHCFLTKYILDLIFPPDDYG